MLCEGTRLPYCRRDRAGPCPSGCRYVTSPFSACQVQLGQGPALSLRYGFSLLVEHIVGGFLNTGERLLNASFDL